MEDFQYCFAFNSRIWVQFFNHLLVHRLSVSYIQVWIELNCIIYILRKQHHNVVDVGSILILFMYWWKLVQNA
jgi:hypothetical protein